MGLSFSVPKGVKVPSSLMNIYKELKQDLGCSIPVHGNLEQWAVQVILKFLVELVIYFIWVSYEVNFFFHCALRISFCSVKINDLLPSQFSFLESFVTYLTLEVLLKHGHYFNYHPLLISFNSFHGNLYLMFRQDVAA